jgi:hypothetical protein
MSMSSINDGGPAFPVADYDHQTFSPGTVDEERRLLSGMSLRDYFAAKALPAVYEQAMRDASEGSGLFHDPDWRLGLAHDAYAMLKVREVKA